MLTFDLVPCIFWWPAQVHFNFRQSTIPDASTHTQLFPQAVLQLASAVPFKQVQLHMTRGRWVRGRGKGGQPR